MVVSESSDDNFVGSGLAGDKILFQTAVGKKLDEVIFPQESTSGEEVREYIPPPDPPSGGNKGYWSRVHT